MYKYLLKAVLLSAFVSAAAASASEHHHQAELARRGAEVMPFSLKASTHVFAKTAEGGVQRVIARRAADTQQVELVRIHLRDLQKAFSSGDFSGPSHIHGGEMAGLAALKAAKPGQIAIAYRDVDGGAELMYRASDAKLVAALHRWFDAQVADHGADAMAGHRHHGRGMTSKP